MPKQPFWSFWPAISEQGWTRRKKFQLGSCLHQRGQAIFEFSGVHTHRKPRKNFYCRGPGVYPPTPCRTRGAELASARQHRGKQPAIEESQVEGAPAANLMYNGRGGTPPLFSPVYQPCKPGSQVVSRTATRWLVPCPNPRPRHSKEWPADLFRRWRGLATGTEPGLQAGVCWLIHHHHQAGPLSISFLFLNIFFVA